MDQCYTFPTRGESRFCPITRTLGQFICPVRSELPTLGKCLVRHKCGAQKKLASLLSVLQTSTGYISGWFETMSWSWTKILNKVIGCPILDSTFVWSTRSFFLNGLWFWAKFITPTLGEYRPNTFRYHLSFPPVWHPKIWANFHFLFCIASWHTYLNC